MKKLENREIIIVSISIWIIGVIPIFLLRVPTLSDETGTIASAAYLAGKDWSQAFAVIKPNYYKYGQGILYAVFYHIFNNSRSFYYIALILNTIFIAIVPIIVYKLCLYYLKLNKRNSILLSILIGGLPSSLLWSKFLWSETLLIFLPWITLYFFLHNSKCDKESKKFLVNSFFAGIFSYFSYMVHSRGIAMLVAAIGTVFIMKIFYKNKVVNLKLYMGVILGSAVVDKLVSSYFRERIWGNEDTNNSISGMIRAVSDIDLFSFNGFKAQLKLMIGWIYGLIGASYGLIFLGIVLSLILFGRLLLKKERNNFILDFLIIFSSINFIVSFAMGWAFFLRTPFDLLYLGGKERFDKIIYARYFASSYGPLLLVFFSKIITQKKEKTWLFLKKAMIIASFICITFLLFFTDYLQTCSIGTIHIINLPFFLPKTNQVVTMYKNADIQFGICTIAVLVILYIFILLLRKRNYISITFISTCLSLIIYISGCSSYIIPVSRFYDSQVRQIEEIFQDNPQVANQYPVVCTFISRSVYSFQFVLDDFCVLTEKSAFEQKNNNLWIVDDKWEERTQYLEGEFYLIVNDKKPSNVLVKGKDIAHSLQKQGLLLQRIGGEIE